MCTFWITTWLKKVRCSSFKWQLLANGLCNNHVGTKSSVLLFISVIFMTFDENCPEFELSSIFWILVPTASRTREDEQKKFSKVSHYIFEPNKNPATPDLFSNLFDGCFLCRSSRYVFSCSIPCCHTFSTPSGECQLFGCVLLPCVFFNTLFFKKRLNRCKTLCNECSIRAVTRGYYSRVCVDHTTAIDGY